MRRLHELHHARELMHNFNFNIVFPLWDWLYGTLYTDNPNSKDDQPMTRMQHHVDIPRAPDHLLAYLATPTRWHEWHHYRVAIQGPKGTLGAGEAGIRCSATSPRFFNKSAESFSSRLRTNSRLARRPTGWLKRYCTVRMKRLPVPSGVQS